MALSPTSGPGTGPVVVCHSDGGEVADHLGLAQGIYSQSSVLQ